MSSKGMPNSRRKYLAVVCGLEMFSDEFNGIVQYCLAGDVF